MPVHKLTTTIRPWGPDGAYVDIPRDVARTVGETETLNVVARLNGVEFRKSLKPRPGGVYRMALGRQVREQAHVAVGENVTIDLELESG